LRLENDGIVSDGGLIVDDLPVDRKSSKRSIGFIQQPLH